MIKLTFKLVILSIFLSTSAVFAATTGFTKELQKEFHERFVVGSNAQLSIENRHGDIKIKPWNNDAIQIDVFVTVKSNNGDKAEQFLSDLHVDFQSSSSRVSAKTIIPDQESNSWWSNWFSDNKNITYEVHYAISAPTDISTVLTNKYGTIVQHSISGDCTITNKYGDVYLDDIGGNLNIQLGYGKVSAGTARQTSIEMKYGSLSMKATENLQLMTKYSKLSFGECNNVTSETKYDSYKFEAINSLQNEGKYDNFQIGSVGQTRIETKYTDINISKLHESASFETKYGSVVIKSSAPTVEKIMIESKYTDYSLGAEGDFHLDFNGSRTNLEVKAPYETYHSDKDGSDWSLKAYRGNKNGTMIHANMRYGHIKID